MKNDELASFGIRAYQSGDYATAILHLQELTTREPQLWTCRLYLAMSYQYEGQTKLALAELDTVSQWATDQSIRSKALAGLRAINALKSSLQAQSSKSLA